MKIRIIFLLSISFLALIVVSSIFLSQIDSKNIKQSAEIDKNETEKLGNEDKDEHGCTTSAGYSWCEEKGKCLQSLEETCTENVETDKVEITAALQKKHNWDEGDIEVFVQKNEGGYASGLVKEIGAMSGAMFFAARVNGSWEIVWDGNGTVDCNLLTDFPNYPSEMISECYDETSGTMIVR